MMHSSVGEMVPAEYNAVFREEAGFTRDYRSVSWRKPVSAEKLAEFHVLIVGAGFSGLGMAVTLDEAGIRYTIIEKNQDVGGTWLENRYPGCAVDTPSHFYSYSFTPNPEWSRLLRPARRDSPVHRELRREVRHSDVDQVRREVIDARYDETLAVAPSHPATRWPGAETLIANAFVPAVGPLNRPSIPTIPGLADFAGPVFHTAQWDQTSTSRASASR